MLCGQYKEKNLILIDWLELKGLPSTQSHIFWQWGGGGGGADLTTKCTSFLKNL